MRPHPDFAGCWAGVVDSAGAGVVAGVVVDDGVVDGVVAGVVVDAGVVAGVAGFGLFEPKVNETRGGCEVELFDSAGAAAEAAGAVVEAAGVVVEAAGVVVEAAGVSGFLNENENFAAGVGGGALVSFEAGVGDCALI